VRSCTWGTTPWAGPARRALRGGMSRGAHPCQHGARPLGHPSCGLCSLDKQRTMSSTALLNLSKLTHAISIPSAQRHWSLRFPYQSPPCHEKVHFFVDPAGSSLDAKVHVFAQQKDAFVSEVNVLTPICKQPSDFRPFSRSFQFKKGL
jgi:hypothetical protein